MTGAEQLALWCEQSIVQARAGDREAADGLLNTFAQLAEDEHAFDAVGGVPKALLLYIATGIADWRKRGYKDAEHWFHVNRPPHAPHSLDPSRTVPAMRAYMLLRARRAKVGVALAGAAKHAGMTEGQVEALLARRDEVLRAAALAAISKRLRKRVEHANKRKSPG